MMDRESGLQLPWAAVLGSAALLIAAGATGAYLFFGRLPTDPSSSTAGQRSAAPAAAAEFGRKAVDVAVPRVSPETPLGDIVVPLTEEAVARAGIEVITVATSGTSSRMRIPGLVQANAYRSVVVTPIVAGKIMRVAAELGQRVRLGQPLADVFSPELAENQTRYLSSRAELQAHEQELRRTEKLVEIGAVSRQELERIHAEHTAATTMVASQRTRLKLLGMTDTEIAALSPSSDVGATVHVASPLTGVITSREANVGANVDATTPLFTVVDLSTVWVVGNLYERDFGAARVGSPAIVTTTAYPALRAQGKVGYVDPQVNAETRTAQVRVEVPNPNGELRLGMYAEMLVEEPRPQSTTVVPRSAVQVVADRTVVYLGNPTQPGRFIEREVRLGETSSDNVQIVSGVQAGDAVVWKGSFAIRAERERLGLRSPLDVREGGQRRQ